MLERFPSRTPAVCTIHAMLASSAFRDYEASPFTWDLTVDPTSVRSRYTSELQWAAPYALTEPATTPAMRAIMVRCLNIQLLVEIDIPASNGTFVTVHDVLHCIYRHLRTQITPEEYDNMTKKTDPTQLEAVIQSYEARYRAIVGDDAARQLEKLKGLKRIDLLARCTRFTGLSPTDRPDEFYILPAPL